MATVKFRTPMRQAYGPGARQYESAVRQAVFQLLQYYGGVAQQDAQHNAPWTDRSGNARQTLRGYADENGDVLRMVLKHGMPYGVYLETKNGGRWGIVTRTVEDLADDVFRAVVTLLK